MAAGSWFGLPELGISERLGGNKASTSKKTAAVNNNVPETKGVIQYDRPIGPVAPTTTNKTNTTTNKSSSSSSSNNSGSSSGKSSAQKQAEAADKARKEADNRVRDSIRSRADALRGAYSTMEARIPQYEQQDTQYVNDQYGNMLGDFDTQYKSSLGLVGNKRGAVDRYQQTATADMASDMRNSLLASQMKVGAMGGGNSSASETMLPYAFSKESGRQRGNIINQANEQRGALDQEEITLKSTYDQGKLEIDNWKIEGLNNVKQQARAELQRIEEAKAQATDAEYAALEQLEMNVLTNAQNTLNQLQTEERTRQQKLENWAMQRYASLQDAKLKLQNSANFDPQQMTYEALDVGNLGANRTDMGYVPSMVKKRKDVY